jgi:hypothetical protein
MKARLKNRFMISTIAFTLLLVSLIALIIIPAFREIKLINEQVLEERLKLETLYTKGQVQKTVQKNYASIEDDIGFLSAILLKENQELEYITALEALAEAIGIEIKMDIGKSKPISEQRFSELEFTFTLNGSWQELMLWMDAVEALPYYTNISEFNVAVREKEGSSNNRTATITIGATTYWLLPTS